MAFLNIIDYEIYSLLKLDRLKEVVSEKNGTANCRINDFVEGIVLSTSTYPGLFLKSKKYANNSITEYTYNLEGSLSGFRIKDIIGNPFDSKARSTFEYSHTKKRKDYPIKE